LGLPNKVGTVYFTFRNFEVSVDMYQKANCDSRSVNSVKQNVTAAVYTYGAICFIVPHLSGMIFFLVSLSLHLAIGCQEFSDVIVQHK